MPVNKVKLTDNQLLIIQQMQDGWTLCHTHRRSFIESEDNEVIDVNPDDVIFLWNEGYVNNMGIAFFLTDLGSQIPL